MVLFTRTTTATEISDGNKPKSEPYLFLVSILSILLWGGLCGISNSIISLTKFGLRGRLIIYIVLFVVTSIVMFSADMIKYLA